MEPEVPAPTDPVDVLVGAGAVFLGHAALVLLTMVGGVVLASAADTLTVAIFVIGGSQLLYVAPLLAWSWRTGRKAFFWGVLGAAAVTLLLNGGCWGFVGANLSGI